MSVIQPAEISAKSTALLAQGNSPIWEVSIDEAPGEDRGWEAEIEGPNFYLVFSLPDFKIIGDALNYLRSGLMSRQGGHRGESAGREGLILGKFDASIIRLIWDDEKAIRCFIIIVGPSGNSAIRFLLSEADIPMLIVALEKIEDELPDEAGLA